MVGIWWEAVCQFLPLRGTTLTPRQTITIGRAAHNASNYVTELLAVYVPEQPHATATVEAMADAAMHREWFEIRAGCDAALEVGVLATKRTASGVAYVK